MLSEILSLIFFIQTCLYNLFLFVYATQVMINFPFYLLEILELLIAYVFSFTNSEILDKPDGND
jgi:hypothetical protein